MTRDVSSSRPNKASGGLAFAVTRKGVRWVGGFHSSGATSFTGGSPTSTAESWSFAARAPMKCRWGKRIPHEHNTRPQGRTCNSSSPPPSVSAPHWASLDSAGTGRRRRFWFLAADALSSPALVAGSAIGGFSPEIKTPARGRVPFSRGASQQGFECHISRRHRLGVMATGGFSPLRGRPPPESGVFRRRPLLSSIFERIDQMRLVVIRSINHVDDIPAPCSCEGRCSCKGAVTKDTLPPDAGSPEWRLYWQRLVKRHDQPLKPVKIFTSYAANGK
jgi:hypothetical protein